MQAIVAFSVYSVGDMIDDETRYHEVEDENEEQHDEVEDEGDEEDGG
jgi:hypothetical protein